MTTDELRNLFTDFFIERGHTLVASDSLVPTYDPSLLFSGAGMNQFKDEFLGRGKRTFKRATSSQKCIRTGDIDSVGVTTSHHVFFEMLGNFSFGDYFKAEAIQWAWEFYQEVLKIPQEKICVSVYENDHEAYGIWSKEIGLPDSKIYRLGEHDNFWPADAPSKAPTGQLCGPCSEIFFDLGPRKAPCTVEGCGPACDCRRYVEIWNLVFQEYQKGEKPGELLELPQKNIDTGAGLERNAAVMQGVTSDFDLDIFVPLVNAAESVLGVKVDRADEERMKYLRRVADYMRAVCFLITDGILPGNDGRGYVEKRLLRRAILSGRALGAEDFFCYQMAAPVADVMGGQYPELRQRQDSIARMVKAEEEKFERTLGAGAQRLNELISDLRQKQQTVLAGEDAFRLKDTYGFPDELVEDTLNAEGMTLEREGFEAAVDAQRQKARAGTKFDGDIFGDVIGRVKDISAETIFMRTWEPAEKAVVKAIIRGDQLLDELCDGEQARLVLDRSPFYPQAGGQVGDSGEILISGHDWLFRVNDTLKADAISLHQGTLESGATIKVGDSVRCLVTPGRRLAVEANHTATHILHHFLREVLGDHVEQSGSHVDSERLRLDFTHFEALSAEDLVKIEDLVNQAIAGGGDVQTRETSVEEARACGAMALFGEKYGSVVRMVTVDLGGGSKSVELCGGTHLNSVAGLELFRIEKEESVASGIRRITGTTGAEALKNSQLDRQVINQIRKTFKLADELTSDSDPRGAQARQIADKLCRQIKVQKDMLGEKMVELVASSRLKDEQLSALSGDEFQRVEHLLTAAREAQKKAAGNMASELALRGKAIAAKARELPGGVLFASAALEGFAGKELRKLADEVRGELPSGVVFLASDASGKVALVTTVSEDLIAKGIKAGDIIKSAAAQVGGGGGGRPNMAQAGGSQPENISQSIAAAADVVSSVLSS